MKKLSMRLLSSFLCLMMLFGTIAEAPIAAYATEVVPTTENVYEEATEFTSTVSENDITEESIDIPIIEESEPEKESAPEEEIVIPESETESTEEPTNITVNFYDDDGTTLLLSVPMQFSYPNTYTWLSSHLEHIGMISMIHNGYALDEWYCMTNGKTYDSYYIYNTLKIKRNLDFKAIWRTEPYDFDIRYTLNGGSFPEDIEDKPTSFNVESDTITLPLPERSKYTFEGWYKDAALTEAVPNIPKGSFINSDKCGDVERLMLYAKWAPIKIGKASKPSAKNSGTGKMKISFKAMDGVDGYEVAYSTAKNFKKNKLTQYLEGKTSVTLTNLPKGKTYYIKVRGYKLDSTGAKIYGKYSSVKSCKIKKGVKEYTAKSNSGKLKKVCVKSKTDLYVYAKVSKRLKSSDDYYYLVKVDPNTGKVLKQIAKTDKTVKAVFQIPLKDEKGNNHVQGKYGVAVKKGKKYMLITGTSFISNPEAAAKYTGAFPKPVSKKGRQGLYDSDMGDKNYFFNFNLNSIIGTKNNHGIKYKYNGKTYYFNFPNFGNIPAVNDDGGTVTVQLMLQYDDNCKDLILKSGRTPGAHYYAFNTDEKASREKLEAAFHFLAEQASREELHIDNWILGNEVNTYANMNAKWYYAGNISKDKFMKNYASTYRMLYYAVKSNSKNSRVYICCDHTWINRENDWGTKHFMEAFNKEIKSQNKNIDWNLAYHAYSAVLTNADFWNDGSLAPNNNGADFVSPKNLEILTTYVKENFGEDVRIILSEQGFSCSGGVGSPYNRGRQSGESVQAAAVAYLYYKAQFNDMIDAVIFSSGDHGGAGYQFDFHGRKAEAVYKYMDTPKYNTYTKAYLKTIGASSWKSIVKGFSDKKLKAMPSR